MVSYCPSEKESSKRKWHQITVKKRMMVYEHVIGDKGVTHNVEIWSSALPFPYIALYESVYGKSHKAENFSRVSKDNFIFK